MAQSPINSPYTPEYAKRVNELKAGSWQDIKDAAEVVEVERKDDSQTWKDLVPDIVKAEFELSEQDIYVEGASPAEIAKRSGAPRSAVRSEDVVYQNWRGRAQVSRSGDKVRTDDYNNLITRKAA